jgi:hypothetical protein
VFRGDFRLLRQNNQQDADFCDDRDAFEKEERQVHGAGDLVRGAWLPGNAFSGGSGESANAEACTDDDHAETKGRAEKRKAHPAASGFSRCSLCEHRRADDDCHSQG